jgi:transposase-like protein
MAINTEQHGNAQRVANGEAPDTLPNLSSKAEYIGRTARIIGRISLDQVEAWVRKAERGTLNEVLAAMSVSLQTQCFDALTDDPLEHLSLNRLYNDRMMQAGATRSHAVTRGRLDAGLDTAERAEGLVLRSLQYATQQGLGLTHRGLLVSQRATFGLALQHVDNLDPVMDAIGQMSPRPFADGGHYPIIKDSVASIDALSGLRLRGMPEYDDEAAEEPRTGCPVTLIKGFVYEYHRIAADAAVANGIITLAD